MSQLEVLYQHYLSHPEICTDTRRINPGCLFFALKGDKFNANDFAAKALEQGAAYAIIDEPAYQLTAQYILVPDVLQTLQDLARYHRNKLNIPVIGLTGSNGKTTTKELIKAVLQVKYRTFATSGNLNNHIGVPLSLLAIKPGTEIAVIEMGANHQQEIAFLCEIAQPTHGLITNIGMAHLDGFGGFEGVKKGKAELFGYLKTHQGIAFINQDNTEITEMAKRNGLEKIVKYGEKEGNLIYGRLIQSDPTLSLAWHKDGSGYKVETQLAGAYNFENILAAITIGTAFDLEPEQINSGLSGYTPVNNRSQLLKTGKNTVICDFYNANPSSMEAAIQNLKTMDSSKKTAILGDMFELGNESTDQHLRIAEQAITAGFNQVIFIGQMFYNTDNAAPEQHYFKTPEEAARWLTVNPESESLILLKGSRGMALEKLLPLF